MILHVYFQKFPGVATRTPLLLETPSRTYPPPLPVASRLSHQPSADGLLNERQG